MFQHQGFDHTGERVDRRLERMMRERIAAIRTEAEHDALVRLAREATADIDPRPARCGLLARLLRRGRM